MSNWLGLEEEIAVVTGAAGGIGQAIAMEFARQGACVAVLDRDAAGLTKTVAAITEAGGTAVDVVCDLSQPESIREAGARVEETLGTCDILVNNAGFLRPGTLDTCPLDEWNTMIAVNLTGSMLCAQTFGRAMLERGHGSLVHIGSIAASHAQGASGAYSATKAAIVMLSRQLATEWGPRGVRSNVVSPGLIRTPLSEAFYADPTTLERRTSVVPVRRIGAPADIANAVLFLASDRASYINGDEVVVDGGFTRSIMNLIPRPGH